MWDLYFKSFPSHEYCCDSSVYEYAAKAYMTNFKNSLFMRFEAWQHQLISKWCFVNLPSPPARRLLHNANNAPLVTSCNLSPSALTPPDPAAHTVASMLPKQLMPVDIPKEIEDGRNDIRHLEFALFHEFERIRYFLGALAAKQSPPIFVFDAYLVTSAVIQSSSPSPWYPSHSQSEPSRPNYTSINVLDPSLHQADNSEH